MLFLKPPFHMIEGVTVFADHENERQFYYLPAMPRLTTVFDPVVSVDIPQLQLLRYRGEVGTGGFLNFGVDLGIKDDTLDSVRIQLKQIHRLRDDPILSPVLLENGTVRLLILGRSSEAPPDGDDEQEQRFVVKIEHASKPSLFGDNRAIFSVELDADGVQLIEKSLEGEIMPIGVIYSLDFLALRPAFQVKVTADWDRVQTHFEESFSVGFLFSSVEIGEVIDELIENRAIDIQIDTFLPEGEEGASFIGHREEAIADFKDMALSSFFEPSLEPMRDEDADADRIAKTASQIALLVASGGWAGSQTFSYKRMDLTRIDKKTLNLSMKERTSMRRSIFPQAHLTGLFRLLRDTPIDMSRFVQDVTLDDDWFRRRAVIAHALANFGDDQIDSINLTLRYGDRPQTIRLTPDALQGSASWNSLIQDGAMRREVKSPLSLLRGLSFRRS